MAFQLLCVLLGIASVYAAELESATEGRDVKCFSCLVKCVFKIPNMKEFGLCLKNCVLPSDTQSRARDVRDGKLPIQSSNPGPCFPLVGDGPHMPGEYDGPQCDADGNFLPLQFDPSSGYAWCVDKDGLQVEGTLTPPGHPEPICGGNDKVAAVENGGDCATCALGCVVSGKCQSAFSLKCWGCVGKCLTPLRSEQIQESESVEEQEDASEDKPINTGEPWVALIVPTTAKPMPPPETSEEQGEQEKSEDSAEFTHPPTHVTFPPVIEPIATKSAEPAESSAELSEPQQQEQEDD